MKWIKAFDIHNNPYWINTEHIVLLSYLEKQPTSRNSVLTLTLDKSKFKSMNYAPGDELFFVFNEEIPKVMHHLDLQMPAPG